jgi:SAM-dependent methyltransferase
LESHEYQTLFNLEPTYWWFRGLHSILLDTLQGLNIGRNARVLDAGCGTGQNLRNISQHLTSDAYGFDLSSEAAEFSRKRGLERTCRASINEIPFNSDTFDAVTSVDVLECTAVSEDAAYSELLRVLKPGGHLILIVPAYDWLMTPEHHKAVGACRRYTRARVRKLLSRGNAEILRITHVFGSVFPAVAAYRLALQGGGHVENDTPRSELKEMHPAVNGFLFRVVNLERKFLRRWNVPFGSSIMAIVRKAG